MSLSFRIFNDRRKFYLRTDHIVKFVFTTPFLHGLSSNFISIEDNVWCETFNFDSILLINNNGPANDPWCGPF